MQASNAKAPPISKKVKLQFLVLGAAGAGKTSLLRRYFYKQFHYERMPTLGSDFYVGNVPFRDQDLTVRIQMWDTPGKERPSVAKQKRKRNHFAVLSDSFFKNADAIMLVYDMSSSTSFTRLLQWYADLMELFKRETTQPLPILIVANKKDLFQTDQPGGRHPPPRVPQRDVLGLAGNYSGNDFHYEYHVGPSTESSSTTTTLTTGNVSLSASTSNKKKKTKDDAVSQEMSGRRRMEISSYLVNRENWTTDFSYLESLLCAEDASLPDRELVLLWCMRNALKMYEASAATGEGVDDAIEALIHLALDARDKENTMSSAAVADPKQQPSYLLQRNQKLDLQERYAPKEKVKCFSFLPPLLTSLNKNK